MNVSFGWLLLPVMKPWTISKYKVAIVQREKNNIA
jgi:hypothetical protein